MLVVQCANAIVLWSFEQLNPTTKVAICANDMFRINYDVSPRVGRPATLQAILQHTVQLGGAVTRAVWVPL